MRNWIQQLDWIVATTHAIGVAMLIVGVVGFILIAFALFVHRYIQRGTRPGEPVCPKCRYIIKGITSITCPECGTDLSNGLAVYIPPPRFRVWPIMLIVYGLFYGVLVPQWAVQYRTADSPFVWIIRTVHFQPIPLLTPAQTSGFAFMVHCCGSAASTEVIAVFAYNGDDFSRTLVVFPSSNRCRLDEPEGWRASGYSWWRISLWRSAHGASVPPPGEQSTAPFSDKTLRELVDATVPDQSEADRALCASELSHIIEAVRRRPDAAIPAVYRIGKHTGDQVDCRFYSTPRNITLYALVMFGVFALWPITWTILHRRRRGAVTP